MNHPTTPARSDSASGAEAPSRKSNLPFGVLLGAVVMIAVAVRVAWIALVNVDPYDGRLDDTVFYWASAMSLANDLEYRDNFGRVSALWPPGYSFVIAPALAILGDHIEVAKGVNVLAAAFTCVMTYVLGARAFDRRVGLVAALLVALSPGQIYFSTLVMSEVVFGAIFLLLLILLLTLTIERNATLPALLLIGALAGFAALTRAEALIFSAMIPLLWKLALPAWRTTIRYTVVFGIGFLVVLAPWTVRNAVRFHEFIPIRANSGGALASALDPNYRSRVGGITGESPELSERISYMTRHPWEFVPLERDKVVDLYGDDRDGIDWIQHKVPLLDRGEAKRWMRLADGYYHVVLVWALFAIPMWLRRSPPGRLVLAFGMLAWSGAELIFWPESRYHFPIVPILSIFAAALPLAALDATVRAFARPTRVP